MIRKPTPTAIPDAYTAAIMAINRPKLARYRLNVLSRMSASRISRNGAPAETDGSTPPLVLSDESIAGSGF